MQIAYTWGRSREGTEMNANNYRNLIAEDASLTVGAEVTVHWTSSFRYMQAPGRVVKVNAKSVRVEISEDVATYWGGKETVGWPKGTEIIVPRLSDYRKWSHNNCVRAIAR
jgi:hypothetical protein